MAEAVHRVSETTLLKAQFENFLEKQAKFEQMFVTDYKTEVINQLTKAKEEFLQSTLDIKSSVQFVKT